MSEGQVLKLLEKEIERAGSALALARKWNISQQYLCDVRKRRRRLTHKVLEPLGLVAFTTYHRMKERP